MKARRIVFICLLVLAALLVGCKQYEPESSESEAEAYYRQKYGEPVKVSDAHGLGSYALFGYEYRGMEYVMDDGISVVYVDDEGEFKDNRQDQEIQQAALVFAQERLSSIEGALTPVSVELVGDTIADETYEGDGSCWHASFEGDIEEFLQEEWPHLVLEWHKSGDDYAEGAFTYQAAYDYAASEGLESAYLELGRYFDITPNSVAVVDGQAAQDALRAGTLTLFDNGLMYVMSFEGTNSAKLVSRCFKPAFISIAKDISVSSAQAGVTLKEGDVTLEKYGDLFVKWRSTLDDDGGAYYVRNDSANSIVRVTGFDQISSVCGPHAHTYSVTLADDEILFVGDEDDIRPWIEILDVSRKTIRAQYHTRFKSGIRKVDVRVIGMAYNGREPGSESCEFASRIVGETEDGWIVEVDVREDAVPDNTLHFQFTYNDEDDVSVQLEQNLLLDTD